MNVKQVVPLLLVSDMEHSLRYYVDGLGFTVGNKWIVDGTLRWCWLTLGGAALMLQEPFKEGPDSWAPEGKVGEGVSLWFRCDDALAIYDALRARNVEISEPQVGNSQWETSLDDPDGYRLHFCSPTDLAEETKLSEVREGGLGPAKQTGSPKDVFDLGSSGGSNIAKDKDAMIAEAIASFRQKARRRG